jgi:glycosyltransferase involved in cell wall biosynthesis
MKDNVFEKDLVSIVIPCYNQGEFLLDAINSALNSTHALIEIIVVDDGSLDNTAEVVREAMTIHEKIFYVYQSNQGPSVARNRAIQESKGEFILPLDADDKISSQYIEKALEVLKNSPEVVLVYCKAEYFGLKSGLWDLKPFSLKKLAIDNMIFSCAMFRREDWKNVGGYSGELKCGWEDWEFWISMLKNGGQVVRLDYFGFYYRIHQYSRRRTNKIKEIEKFAIDFVNQKHYDFIFSQLKGPLRMNRKRSLLINTLYSFFGIAKFKREQMFKVLMQLKIF